MSGAESRNLVFAREYIAALERGAVGDELAAFFTEDVIQEEFPNRLTPQGARRDLQELLEGAERGQQVVARQRYDILNALEDGETVVLEIDWTSTLAVGVGSLVPGDDLRARFAVFLELRDGRIARQRNYDCFESW